ncbi:MAG: helix-turn-helix transcriptional regulator [Verrucomicrobiae bacterium]|nr:helix-turn-helix transcriptional regulator [Verrucomicrobiae bacterium]
MPADSSNVPLYGDPNRSGFWVQNLIPSDSGKSTLLNFTGDQILFICLRDGNAWFEDGHGGSAAIGSSQIIIGASGSGGASLRRNAPTDGVVVGFRRQVIRESLDRHRPALLPALLDLVFSKSPSPPPLTEPLAEHIRGRWIDEFRNPPVSGSAATFWFESKVREFIAVSCFARSEADGEFFCSRQKRLAADRIEMAKAWLEAHFDEPLSLAALAEHVGCSTHYLSRTFSDATGKTISQYLRALRIEKAARLISSGRFNVSEAALEVGYQSLSHFSKAFLKEKGCLPSRYQGN